MASGDPLQCAYRPRWKPNQAQISLLEQHFNAGHSKPTPELTAAVQQAGSATEQQVLVSLLLDFCQCAHILQTGILLLPCDVTSYWSSVQVIVWLKNRLARAKRDAKVSSRALHVWAFLTCYPSRLELPM